MYGAGKGFEKGLEFLQKSKIKHPIAASAILLGSAALGGFTGNLAVGGVQRTGREALLDSFYNTPPRS